MNKSRLQINTVTLAEFNRDVTREERKLIDAEKNIMKLS